MFRTIAQLVPPPPGARSPLLWGTEDNVRALLGDGDFERREAEWSDSSVRKRCWENAEASCGTH